MKKKLWISGAVVVMLAAAAYFTFLRGATAKYELRFDKVSTGDVSMLVTATGTINPVTSVDVGTQVSGIISRLYADFNSVVKEGQIIAQIDPTFLQQSVKDAEASLDRARAQAADAQRTLQRTKALFEKNLESQLNYDAAVTTYETTQAALKQATAALDRAKINLAYATIYAPISGVVIDRKVNVGQTVAASFSSPTLYTIANDLSRMQVQTTVDESDIGRISIGQEATFTVDAYPNETFSGTVSQIRLAPQTVQNVVNYQVIVGVNNDQLKLMPGMTANVRILVASASNVLRVPNMALRFQPPTELVDSAKIAAMREQFAGMRGGMGADSTRAGRGDSARTSGGGRGRWMADAGSAGPGAGNGADDQSDRRKMFQAVRDSILAAHGGTMEPDAMFAEVRKAMEARGVTRGQGRQAAAPVARPVAPKRGDTKFGITQTYPEYQKSAFSVARQGGRARIWVLNSKGKLEPVNVRTGITDGRYTEVVSNDLKVGDQIVMGATSNNESAQEQSRSPLQGGPGGGGMRGMR